jgi:hypothetical protein
MGRHRTLVNLPFASNSVRLVDGSQSDRLAVLRYKRECWGYFGRVFISIGGRLDERGWNSDFLAGS